MEWINRVPVLPAASGDQLMRFHAALWEMARLAYQAGADRPKLPSLKRQALEHLASGCFPYTESTAVIREALESLPDD